VFDASAASHPSRPLHPEERESRQVPFPRMQPVDNAPSTGETSDYAGESGEGG